MVRWSSSAAGLTPLTDDARRVHFPTMPGLPEFANPPVDELVLGLQCEPLQEMAVPHLGLFWLEVRADYPKVEEKPALDPQIEPLDEYPRAPTQGLRLLDKPELPRVWFVSPSENEIVQLQRDRIHFNWRRRALGDTYPRYSVIREKFKAHLEKLQAFVEREGLGGVRPLQVEITYINTVPTAAKDSAGGFGPMEDVFSIWRGLDNPEVAIEISQFNIATRVRGSGGKTLGRVRVGVLPGFSRLDKGPIYKLDLTARGVPDGEGVDGVMSFLDQGHDAIVRLFDAITTESMHKVWGRS